jgi:hypothetical protein
MRKGFFMTSATLILIAAVFAGCKQDTDDLNAQTQEVSEIVMSPSAITIKEGASATIGARISKWNASAGKSITWAVDDPTIASVTQEGIITGIAIGETDVKASSGGKTGTCHVTVVDSRIPADSLKLDASKLRIKQGAKASVNITVYPSNSTDTPVWTSSDESVATVDASGVITGKNCGYATITAKAGDAVKSVVALVHGDIWLEQVDALIKPTTFEDHPFETDTIRVARGETATVQMMVYCDKDEGTITPSITQFALKGGAGISISPELHWVRNVKCTPHWDQWAGGAAPDRYPKEQLLIPDALMPLADWTVDLPNGNQTAFWAEFDIPRDAPAGIYEGIAKIEGYDSGELPFVVKVYDVTLPEKQTLDVMQWINGDLRAMNNGADNEMYANYGLIENIIVPFVSKYGQNCFNSQYYQTYNTGRKLVKNASGEWEMTADFSTLGREIEMYYRACPNLHYVQGPNIIASAKDKTEGLLVMLGIQLNEDGSPKGTDNGDGTYSPVWTYVDQRDQYSPEVEMYCKLYFQALEKYLKSHSLPDGRTYLDVYLQTLCDEPNDKTAPAYMRVASYIKKGAPDLKIMDPLGTHKITDEYLDVPCPCIDVLQGEAGYEYTDKQIPWIYCAMGPQGNGLNRFIRIPLIKTRLIHWLNYRYNTVGFLHWGLNYWYGAPNGDPWKDAYGEFIGGDMWIIWPGNKKVYPSIRLSAMRDGIRDYELLRMVGQKSKAEADAMCRSIVTDTWNYTTDVEAFRAERKAILEYLSGE